MAKSVGEQVQKSPPAGKWEESKAALKLISLIQTQLVVIPKISKRHIEGSIYLTHHQHGSQPLLNCLLAMAADPVPRIWIYPPKNFQSRKSTPRTRLEADHKDLWFTGLPHVPIWGFP